MKAAKYSVSGLVKKVGDFNISLFIKSDQIGDFWVILFQKLAASLSEVGAAEFASVASEHPSPVSVLDDTMYRDDTPSPVKQIPDTLKGSTLIYFYF